MPVLTANHALLAAAGALGLTLYDRGVFQSVWNALKGGDVPLSLAGAQSLPPGAPPDTTAIDNPPMPGATIDWNGAEQAVLAQGAPGGGGDWLNWCLNFVNRVYQRVGRSIPALGNPTAAGACGQLSLTQGIAPKGAIVCFAPTGSNPDGHIGIANGNNTYTSTGITHGGISVLDYLSNPLYTGWSNG